MHLDVLHLGLGLLLLVMLTGLQVSLYFGSVSDRAIGVGKCGRETDLLAQLPPWDLIGCPTDVCVVLLT